jgi:hypothetical protein
MMKHPSTSSSAANKDIAAAEEAVRTAQHELEIQKKKRFNSKEEAKVIRTLSEAQEKSRRLQEQQESVAISSEKADDFNINLDAYPHLQRIRSAWAKDLELETRPSETQDPEADDPSSQQARQHSAKSVGSSPLARAASRLSVIGEASVQKATSTYFGVRDNALLSLQRARWSGRVLTSPPFRAPREEVLRHHLLSNYAFFQASGWHVVTREARFVVEPVTGIDCSEYEARWTMFLTLFGGMDLTVIHFFFLISYMPRLGSLEAAVVGFAFAAGIFQATRHDVVRSLMNWHAEIVHGALGYICLALLLIAIRFVVASIGLAPECPFFTWLFGVWVASVMILEYPLLLLYEYCVQYPEKLKLRKTKKSIEVAIRGPPGGPSPPSASSKISKGISGAFAGRSTDSKTHRRPREKLWLSQPPTLESTVIRVDEIADEKPLPRFTTWDDPQIASWVKLIESKPIEKMRRNLEVRLDGLVEVCSTMSGIIEDTVNQGHPYNLPLLKMVSHLGHLELKRSQLAIRAVQVAQSHHFRLGSLGSRADLLEAALPDAPKLHLVHWRTIVELGRLPQFDFGPDIEDKRISTAIEVFAEFQHRAIMIPVIHRWRDGDEANPDPSGITARQLTIFALWYKNQWGDDVEPFFWIDYCCLPSASNDEDSSILDSTLSSDALRRHSIASCSAPSIVKDMSSPLRSHHIASESSPQRRQSSSFQAEPSLEIQRTETEKSKQADPKPKTCHDSRDAMLPLIFAASDAVLVCEAHDSDRRSWCRLEACLAYAFAPSCNKMYAVQHKLGTIRVANRKRGFTGFTVGGSDASPKSGRYASMYSTMPSGSPKSRNTFSPKKSNFDLLNPIEDTKGKTYGRELNVYSNEASPQSNVLPPKPSPLSLNTNLSSASFDSSSPVDQVEKSARKALERSRWRLVNKYLAPPDDWEEVKMSHSSDRARIEYLLRTCVAHPTMYTLEGIRRKPIDFDRSVVHVHRLERVHSGRRPALRMSPKASDASPGMMWNSDANRPRARTDSFATGVSDDSSSNNSDEEEVVEEEEEKEDAQPGRSPDEALEVLSLRKDRSTQQHSTTLVYAHVRQPVNWEEKSKDLYFQNSLIRRRDEQPSWQQDTRIGVGDSRSQAIYSPYSPTGGASGFAYSGPDKGIPMSIQDISNSNLRLMAAAATDDLGRNGPTSHTVSIDSGRPLAAVDLLLQRADEAASTRDSTSSSIEQLSTKPTTPQSLDTRLIQDRFHPEFRPPAILLSDGGLVATQLRANSVTGNMLTDIGLPGRPIPQLPSSPSGRGPSDLSSGGMAVTMHTLPVRRGVMRDFPAASGTTFTVKVEAVIVDERFNDGLGIGFTTQEPEKHSERHRPRHASAMASTWMCGYTGKWMMSGKKELMQPYRGKTWKPWLLKVGDILSVSVAVAPADLLRIMVNGNIVAEHKASTAGLTAEVVANLRGVVDIEGWTVSVRLATGPNTSASRRNPATPTARNLEPLS